MKDGAGPPEPDRKEKMTMTSQPIDPDARGPAACRRPPPT